MRRSSYFNDFAGKARPEVEPPIERSPNVANMAAGKPCIYTGRIVCVDRYSGLNKRSNENMKR